MMKINRGINKCGHCGLFLSWGDCDQYTNFGSSNDLEPPDPILICKHCSKYEEDRMVKNGSIWTPWIPGDFHHRAAKRLGWKYAHPSFAAWGEYRDPNKPLPEGWEWNEEKSYA